MSHTGKAGMGMAKHRKSGKAHKGGLATILFVRDINQGLKEKEERRKQRKGRMSSNVKEVFGQ